jgi:hypothetical protein
MTNKKTISAEGMNAVAAAFRPFFTPGTNFIPGLRENMYGKFTVKCRRICA